MQQSIHYVKKGLNAYMLFIIIYPYELENDQIEIVYTESDLQNSLGMQIKFADFSCVHSADLTF
jgi:hypothetical protein